MCHIYFASNACENVRIFLHLVNKKAGASPTETIQVAHNATQRGQNMYNFYIYNKTPLLYNKSRLTFTEFDQKFTVPFLLILIYLRTFKYYSLIFNPQIYFKFFHFRNYVHVNCNVYTSVGMAATALYMDTKLFIYSNSFFLYC